MISAAQACAAEETEHADDQSQLPTLEAAVLLESVGGIPVVQPPHEVSNFEETAFLFDYGSRADNAVSSAY